jgi:hypothetical protein
MRMRGTPSVRDGVLFVDDSAFISSSTHLWMISNINIYRREDDGDSRLCLFLANLMIGLSPWRPVLVLHCNFV